VIDHVLKGKFYDTSEKILATFTNVGDAEDIGRTSHGPALDFFHRVYMSCDPLHEFLKFSNTRVTDGDGKVISSLWKQYFKYFMMTI